MNNQVARELAEVSDLYDRLGDNVRAMVFRRAAKSVAAAPFDVSVTPPNLTNRKLPGVGAKVIEAIKDRCRGRRRKLQSELKSREELLAVMGAGPAAVTGWRAAGVKTLSDLRRAAADGRVRLTHAQQLGVLYYRDLLRRIPRREVEEIAAEVRELFPRGTPFEVAGSYRRGRPDSGDVDILVSTKALPAAQLTERAAAVVSSGPQRITVLWPSRAGVVQVDVLNIPKESWAAALAYFTGSWEHNQRLRSLAKSKGLRLNQYGLFKGGKSIPLKTERDLYKALGLTYVEPHARIA